MTSSSTATCALSRPPPEFAEFLSANGGPPIVPPDKRSEPALKIPPPPPAPLFGGLELNGSSLAVSGGSIAENSAPDGAGVFNNLGTTSINGTSISKNTAALEGGGIFSRSLLTLTRVQLGTTSRPNLAEDGGGLYTVNVGATIVRSTIDGNRVRNAGAGSGGGIFNSSNADVELDRTTLTGNSSGHAGGAITNFGARMTITATALSDNHVIGGAGEAFGGGISNMFDAADGQATLYMVNER